MSVIAVHLSVLLQNLLCVGSQVSTWARVLKRLNVLLVRHILQSVSRGRALGCIKGGVRGRCLGTVQLPPRQQSDRAATAFG